jgi:hypothetical protein
VGEVPLREFWGMFGESLVMLLAVFALVIVIFYLHHIQSKALLLHVENLKDDLTNDQGGLDELKEDVLDIVQDTIRNLQPPNAFDHLLGAIAPAIQSWALRKAGINPATGQPLQELLEEKIEEIIP